MFIDKILARFKIQTKVLVFILPFVLSICAVGFTGLYASGLLQGRMEISNSVLQSLSGFKDVYAGMNRFLQNTTEENRKAVHERLTAQVGVLQSTMNGLAPDADKSKLVDAEAHNWTGTMREVRVNVTIGRGATFWGNLVLALILVLAPFALILWRHVKFESARLAESDKGAADMFASLSGS